LAGLLKKRVQNYTLFWFSQTVDQDSWDFWMGRISAFKAERQVFQPSFK
jgi:hypothetical protein